VKARFKPGDRVRVRVDAPPRHIRTPAYIQGKTGHIEAIHGAFRNSESRAYGSSGLPKRFLYLVAFELNSVWGPDAAPPQDKLLIDLYEHWLESA
jgi:nitrile hydratase subunit beta